MDELLGEGKEGAVYRQGHEVVKFFKPGVFSDETGARLIELVKAFRPPFPDGVCFGKEGAIWVARYPWFDSEQVDALDLDEVKEYLIAAGKLRVIADNFKMSNLRRRSGKLVNVDVGRHIRVFNRSTFRDVCAKAFFLLSGKSEQQLVSDFGSLRDGGGVAGMPGFEEFYASIVRRIAEDFWQDCPKEPAVIADQDVSLLIKCCAMDSGYIERQVGHIVNQLSSPRKLKEVVLSIDTKTGSYLRQHASGDLAELRRSALRLLDQGVVDRVIEAPSDSVVISDANLRWFGVSTTETHTETGIPVFPQIWAFEQIGSNYVLQADCDVIISRHDHSHDYLAEMVAAHQPQDVMGVGFNIPHSSSMPAKEYEAPVGGYKPEVRLGLFDLRRLRSSTPWRNPLSGKSLRYGWYQALHQALAIKGWRCLRGGDPRTAYIHPLNSAKQVPGLLDKARRCVESGHVPEAQLGHWDLVEDASLWNIASPWHEIVIALEPSDCSRAMIERCVGSLVGQEDTNFGIVVIEDAVRPARTAEIVSLLNISGLRGRVVSGLGQLMAECSTAKLFLRLRLDEALMSPSSVSQLKLAVKERGCVPARCFCESEGLRQSPTFGLGRMYDGDVQLDQCSSPRCLALTICEKLGLLDQGLRPACRALDSFAETPPSGGNIRPSVMAGFVIWTVPGGQFEK
jgi:hypothetical protein